MKKFLVIIFAVLSISLCCSCNMLSLMGVVSNVSDVFMENANENSDNFEVKNNIPGKNSDGKINGITQITCNLSDYYTPHKLDNGYEHLENNAQKEIYNDIFSSVYSVENYKTNDQCFYLMGDVKYSGKDEITERDMIIAYAAFKNDHPEYFWLDTECVAEINNDGDSFMYIYSLYSPDDVAEMSEEFMNAAEEIVSSVPDNLSEYERELYIHDVIYDICEYDDDAADVAYGNKYYTYYYNSYNAYGVLVDGDAVCQGYADAYAYLLSCVGINNTQISSQDHIWNAVEIDNQWYNVDVTWDDTTQTYDYFNVTDDIIEEDHEIAPLYTQMTDDEILGTEEDSGLWFNVYLPECNATKYSYSNQGLS